MNFHWLASPSESLPCWYGRIRIRIRPCLFTSGWEIVREEKCNFSADNSHNRCLFNR
jgi:hypothetical protein